MKKIKSDIDIYIELIKQTENEISSIRKLIAPLNDELTTLCERNKTLNSQLDALKIKNTKKPDWNFILHSGQSESMELHRYRNEMLRSIGLSSSGYFPETKQAAIQLTLIKGKPETKAKTLKSLSMLLPYIKPVAGTLRFGIFEHTLCEYGIYTLVLNKKWEIHFTRYSHTTTEQSFDTLKEAIEYIYENHYYEKV